MKRSPYQGIRMLLITLCTMLFSNMVLAQKPGSTLSNPINIGTLSPGVPYYDTQNNSPGNGFGNEMGYPNDDIYHKFTLSKADTVNLSHCGSGFDSFLYLLDAAGNIITSNDDNGPLCQGLDASIVMYLNAGTYYAVSEGWTTFTGTIALTINIHGKKEEIISDFSNQVTTITSNLELSRVPYGLLRDLAFEQTELDNFNGTILVDSNLTTATSLNAIYQTLQSAKVTSNAFSFPKASTLDSLNNVNRQPGKIILSGLYFKYSQFKANAVQNNLIKINNNKIYDVYTNGVWQNAYDVKNAFAFSPSIEEYSGKAQQFLIPVSTWIGNDMAAVASIQLDPGDGSGYRTIIPGQPVSANYANTGSKTLILKLNLQNNTVLYSHSKINIIPSLLDSYPGLVQLPITATEPFAGKYASGTITIKYANADHQLRNPLIVAEGFDTGIILSPDNEYGDVNYDNFVKNVQRSTALNNVLYGQNTTYDIVYVDWKDGTDNIKKNALLLKDVIRKVNAMKALSGSTSKNVIIGMSMGGLISRWALKDMENKSENHQTKLFVSYDTPHQGANVPLGYQFMANHIQSLYLRSPAGQVNEYLSFAGLSSSVTKTLRLASRPAPRQMLINYVNPHNIIDNSVHVHWQEELRLMGYPKGYPGAPIRNIAISNAVECGTLQPAAANSTLLRYTGKGNTNFLGDIAAHFAAPFVTFAAGKPQFLLGVIPGKNSLFFNIEINTTANGGGNLVYYNKITYQKKILWLIPINVDITKASNFAPSGALPYDSYPGGAFDTQWDPAGNLAESGFLGRYNISVSHQRRFNFVPSVSALDIGSGNVPLSNADYTAKYIGSVPLIAPKTSPFANFITARELNEGHTSMSEPTGVWLKTELSGTAANAVNCSYLCDNTLQISGSYNVCTAENYSITGIPPGMQVSWSVSDGIQIITTKDNGYTISVVPKGNGIDYHTIYATVSGACGVRNLHLTIRTEPTEWPVYGNTNSPIRFDFGGSTLYGNYSHYPGSSNETFEVYPEDAHFIVSGSGYFELEAPSGASGTYYVTITTMSQCGKAISTTGTANLDRGSWRDPYAFSSLTATNSADEAHNAIGPFKYFPNPINDRLTIKREEIVGMASTEGFASQASQKNNTPKKDKFETRLYDQNMKIVAKQEGNEQVNDITLETSHLQNGTYFLHVIHKNKLYKKQVIVKR